MDVFHGRCNRPEHDNSNERVLGAPVLQRPKRSGIFVALEVKSVRESVGTMCASLLCGEQDGPKCEQDLSRQLIPGQY